MRLSQLSPNQSPGPIAVGAGRSAVAVLRWLSFLGIMRIAFIMFVLLGCGCNKSRQQAKLPIIPQYTIFDETIAKPEYADVIKQAERDLPDDKWMTEPFRANRSRAEREYHVVTNILAAIEPKLKRMSVTELVRSLKIEMGPTVLVTNDFSGVAEGVYLGGYSMIKKEIQSRPKKELEVLPSLGDNSVWLFTGPQGPPVTLESFVQYDLFEK